VDSPKTTAEADAELAVTLEDDESMADAEPVARRSARASRVSVRLLHLLERYCEATGAGWVFDSVVGCDWFASDEPGQIPNVAFIARGRLKDEAIPDGDLAIPPDFVAVVVLPGEGACAVNRKVEGYLEAGVRLVWVIDPKSRIGIVHRPNGTGLWVREGDDLDGEDVVPGFRCPLASILPTPEHETNGQSDQDEP
jgi:Uma2 family endonuclease